MPALIYEAMVDGWCVQHAAKLSILETYTFYHEATERRHRLQGRLLL